LEACRAQVLDRAGVGRRVLLRASQDQLLSWRVQSRSPRLVLQPLPRARVLPRQALERESRTRAPGRHVSRDEGSLDEDRPRARERIDERRAPIPLGKEHHAGGERLCKRRRPLEAPPPTLVKRLARRVDRDRAAIARDMDVNREIGRLLVDGWAFARERRELIDDGILRPLLDEERMVERRLLRLRIDDEASLGTHEAAPIDLRDAAIERVGIPRRETRDAPEDANGGAKPQVRATRVRELAAKVDAPHLALELRKPELARLLVKDRFE